MSHSRRSFVAKLAGSVLGHYQLAVLLALPRIPLPKQESITLITDRETAALIPGMVFNPRDLYGKWQFIQYEQTLHTAPMISNLHD